MSKIIGIAEVNISFDREESFIDQIDRFVKQFQEKDFEVEIQYSCSSTNRGALIIGREKMKEGFTNNGVIIQ